MADVYKARRIRVAIYCRISLARHGDQVKVERQEGDCRTLCERLGWDVEYVFVDNNKSAWQRDRKRPGWDAMLACIERDEVDAIVVYHGDRLIRQPWDLELLLRLADEKRIQLASPIGTRNLNSADDRFILRIEAAQACRESDNTSRRALRGQQARVEAGRPAQGGTRSFGYDRDMTIRKDEAEVIQEMASRILAGEKVYRLVGELAERGVVTPVGNRWERSGFQRMLQRPDLAGLVSHRGVVVKPGPWKPILEREVWETLQVVLRERSDAHPQRDAHRYLLSSLAKCNSCDRGLTGQTTSRGFEVYRCPNAKCTKRVSRNREHLDEYVIAFVMQRLSDSRLWRRLNQVPEGDGGAAAELEALEARKHQVAMEFANDDRMDPMLLRGMLNRLDDRIGEIRSRIAAVRGPSILRGCEGLRREQWDVLPLDRRRAIVSELCVLRVWPAVRGRGFDIACVDLRRASGQE
jgi:DNA invertase Pin-like site-specific DNA recombinase